MALHDSILQVLETNKVHYALRDKISRSQTAGSNAEACLVKSLLLKDGNMRVQVLLPWNRYIDLAAVENEFQLSLTAMPQEELQALLDQTGLVSVPAIPQWEQCMTVVDGALLKYATLWLETGTQEQMIELERDDFCSMVTTAKIGRISSEAPELPNGSSSDKEQITSSVQRFTQLRIKQRLEDTLELPPLADTARRIIQLRANPDSDISDLTEIVELDPSLSAQVVSWAASPYYSAPGKIKSVHDAVVRVLGFDMVLNLALGLALGKTMSASVMSRQQIATYWTHAVCVAATVEGLVTAIPREHRPAFGMSYLAGLLSNFGHLVLAEVFPPYYSNIIRHLDANPHVQAHAIETSIVGVSSCQIASWLLESWNMPEEVVAALRHQHNPHYTGENCEYAHLIFIAEQLLARKGFSHRTPANIPQSLFENLKLDADTAEATVNNVLESNTDLEAIAKQMAR